MTGGVSPGPGTLFQLNSPVVSWDVLFQLHSISFNRDGKVCRSLSPSKSDTRAICLSFSPGFPQHGKGHQEVFVFLSGLLTDRNPSNILK